MWRSSEGACVCVHWMWDTWSDSINKLSVQAPLILYSCVYIQYIQYVHAMGVILLLTCTWSVGPTVLIRSSTQWHLWPRVAVESEEVFQLVVPMFCCFAPQALRSISAHIQVTMKNGIYISHESHHNACIYLCTCVHSHYKPSHPLAHVVATNYICRC